MSCRWSPVGLSAVATLLVFASSSSGVAEGTSKRIEWLEQHQKNVAAELTQAHAEGNHAVADVLAEVRRNIQNTLDDLRLPPQRLGRPATFAAQTHTVQRAGEESGDVQEKDRARPREPRRDRPHTFRDVRPERRGHRHPVGPLEAHQSREEHIRAAIHHLEQAGMGEVAQRIRAAARRGHEQQPDHDWRPELRRAMQRGHERIERHERMLDEVRRDVRDQLEAVEHRMHEIAGELEERIDEVHEQLEEIEQGRRRHPRDQRSAGRADRQRLEETIRRFQQLIDDAR